MILFSLLCSCAKHTSTTPNIAFGGEYPQSFSVIKNTNPLLAKEIGKLPELQDGISPEEAAAIEILADAYKKSTNRFNDAFQKMNDVGIPSVRKFCVPLQALFWLAEDGREKAVDKQITNFNLESLLNASWDSKRNFNLQSINVSEGKALEILESLDKTKFWYQGLEKSPNEALVYCYNLIPEAFPAKYRRFIEGLPDVTSARKRFNLKKRRLSDADAIIDRLNDPQLLEYWLYKNFIYDWKKYYAMTKTGIPKSVAHTIQSKRGVCLDAANLGVVCLRQAGYDVTGLNVYFTQKSRVGALMHAVCLLHVTSEGKDEYYKLADTNALSPYQYRGPFKSIKEIAVAVAEMHKVPLYKYSTGLAQLDLSLSPL